MGAAALARPEMAVAAGMAWVLAVVEGWRRLGGEEGGRRRVALGAAASVGTAAAMGLPWLIYCRWATGRWLPNTFYAKGNSPELSVDKFKVIYDMLEHGYWPSAFLHDPLGWVMLALGMVWMGRRIWGRATSAAWLLLPLTHVVSWALMHPDRDTDRYGGEYLHFAVDRYYIVDYPLVYGVLGLGAALAAMGVSALGRRLETGLRPGADRWVRRALAGGLIGLVGVGSVIGWWSYCGPLWVLGSGAWENWLQIAGRNESSCRNIMELHEEAGRWFAAEVPPDAVVATEDAGAIRYFTQVTLVDLLGLNSHDYLFSQDKVGYLEDKGLQYVALFSEEWFPELASFRMREVQQFATMGNVSAVSDRLTIYRVEGRRGAGRSAVAGVSGHTDSPRTDPGTMKRGGKASRVGERTIADLGERAYLARVRRWFEGSGGEGVVLGIGDDAAVLRRAGAGQVVTVDLLVEGVHFRRDWTGARDLGRKALAVNLSDIAAMGARPVAAFLGLSVPGSTAIRELDGFFRGIGDEAGAAGLRAGGGGT